MILIVLEKIVAGAGSFLVHVDWTEANEPNEKVNVTTNMVGEI